MRVLQPEIEAKRNAGKPQCLCTGNRCPTRSSAGGCDCDLVQNRCTIGAPITEPSKYLGLLMYAVRANDPAETKVGSWEFPVSADAARFASMTGPGCDDRAIVQTSALPKRFTEHFWWRAPPANTGSVVFRVVRLSTPSP